MPALRFELPVEHLAQSGRQVPKVHLSTPYPWFLQLVLSGLSPWPALAGLGHRGARCQKKRKGRGIAQMSCRCRADVVQMSCRCRASCPVTSCDLTRLPYQPYQPCQPWIYQPWIMLQMLQAVSRDQPTGQSSCLAGGVDAVLRTLGISCHTGYWYLGKSWNEFD